MYGKTYRTEVNMAKVKEAKRKITKDQAQKLLGDVPEDKVFWGQNGKVFRNLYELERGLNSMADEAYRYHVNVEKNDFSVWVRQVIGDESLADDLENTQNRLDAAMKVESRIHLLISK
jgi:hypothetical protein